MTTEEFTYGCFGLCIGSNFDIPELQVVARAEVERLDLAITLHAPADQEPFHLKTGYSIKDPQTIYLHLPALATFVIKDGSEIEIFAHRGADLEDIRVYLLGSALGAALHQRATPPLHASAIKTSRGVMAFSGPSGYGKSTIIAGLWQRGFEVVSDDILVLHHRSGRGVSTFRGLPSIKVLPDALSRLAIENNARLRWSSRAGKYYVPTNSGEALDPLEVTRLYFLHDAAEDDSRPVIRRITKTDSIMHLVRNIYRPELIGSLNAQGRLLPHIAGVVSSVECFVIDRLRGMELSEFVDAVESHVNGPAGVGIGVTPSRS